MMICILKSTCYSEFLILTEASEGYSTVHTVQYQNYMTVILLLIYNNWYGYNVALGHSLYLCM